MIITQTKEIEVIKVGNLDEGLESEIDDSSIPYVLRMASKNLYADPIGSVVREITSNCFDAHKGANNTEDPVIISSGKDEEGEYIQFQDFGTGMSPETVNDIYRKYFSSTKRVDNSQHGGWGLGSKTPFAYTEIFYMTTVFDGIRYEYIYHKGELKPTIESIYGWTTETRYRDVAVWDDNGVPVVDINGNPVIKTVGYQYKLAVGEETEERNGTIIKIALKEYGDRDKFTKALRFQLTYFDNVYFKGWPVPNDFNIYEGKYFKYRSDILNDTTETHICLGKVRYPLDFNRLDIPKRFHKMPVAVKFEIGELDVTLSREALEYNERTIKAINEKVNLAGEELLEMFNAQNPEVETLEQWRSVENVTPTIVFNEAKNHRLKLWAYSGIEKRYMFKPLRDIGLKHTPSNIFFMWECFAYISSSGIRHPVSQWNSNNKVDNQFILDNKFLIVKKEDKVSTFTDLYISTEFGRQDVYLIRRKEYKDTDKYTELDKALKMDSSKVSLGKAKTQLGFIRKINEIVKEKSAGTYAEWRATDEWIAQYKREQIESTAAWQRKKANKIFFRYANGGSGEMTEYEFLKRTGILIYGFKEDKAILTLLDTTVRNGRHFSISRGSKGGRTAFMVIIIAKSVEENILGAPKTIYWRDFINKTSLFRKIHTSYLMHRKLSNFRVESEYYRDRLIPNYKEDREQLEAEIRKYHHNSRYYCIPPTYTEDVKPDLRMLKQVDDFIAKYDYKIPLINRINTYLDIDQLGEVIEYLKLKKVRLKNKFYLKTADQLREEARDKACKIGIEQILHSIQQPILNYYLTLNQSNNGESSNNENGISNQDGGEYNLSNQTGGDYDSLISGWGEAGEIRSESDNGAGGSDNQESEALREETLRSFEEHNSEVNDTGSYEEEGGERGDTDEGESSNEADQESYEESYF